LNVDTNAEESQIKKSYKKLALQLHPDKNRAPGSEEAFKKVSQAFSCLSDPSKRRMYNVRGEESNVRVQNRNSFDGDLSPDEIFSMFFGGRAAEGRTHYRTYTFNRQSNARQHQTTESGSFVSMLQLLPLLFVLLFAFLSGPSDPIFQFHRSRQYPVEMKTQALQIPYFVKSSFDAKDLSFTKEVEDNVEETWTSHMKTQCYHEQLQQKRNVASAWTVHQRNIAEKQPKPSCDELLKRAIPLRW